MASNTNAFCKMCGTPHGVEARFCPKCGDRIDADHSAGPTAMRAPALAQPVDNEAFPSHPSVRRGVSVPWVLGGALAICGAFGLALLAGSVFVAPPPAAMSTVAAPPVAVEAQPVPHVLIVPGEPVRTAELYADRLADQVDLERQDERVRQLRFRISSQAVIPQLGEDRPSPVRSSWAVPMGIVEREGRRHLAVATTRCVVDYRYPTDQARDGYANLALFLGAGRERQVFRVGAPTVLPGVANTYDQAAQAMFFTSRYHLAGPTGNRFFGELQAHPEWRVTASLPVGNWQTMDGVDMVILYVPLDDPGSLALEPRRHLEADDPEDLLRRTLTSRTSLWGDTFTYSLVSTECMRAMRDEVRQLEDDATSARQMMTILGGLAAMSVLGPALPALIGDGVLSTILGRAQAILGDEVMTALTAAVWRTSSRLLQGEELQEVLWSEGGQLVMSVARESGVRQVVLAGLSRTGLSDVAAASIVETVQSFVGTGTGLTVMTRDGSSATQCHGTTTCVGSLLQPDDRLDVAAELLRRGFARVDTSDEQVLAQQPTLVRAARDAIVDPGTREAEAIDDDAYRAAVVALAERLIHD